MTSEARTIDTRETLRGTCTLTISGDTFEMRGPSGLHSLDAPGTDTARLDAHWAGFVANNGGEAPPAPPAAPATPDHEPSEPMTAEEKSLARRAIWMAAQGSTEQRFDFEDEQGDALVMIIDCLLDAAMLAGEDALASRLGAACERISRDH